MIVFLPGIYYIVAFFLRVNSFLNNFAISSLCRYAKKLVVALSFQTLPTDQFYFVNLQANHLIMIGTSLVQIYSQNEGT